MSEKKKKEKRGKSQGNADKRTEIGNDDDTKHGMDSGKHTLLIYNCHQCGRKASSIWSKTGFPSLKRMEMMSNRVFTSRLFLKI